MPRTGFRRQVSTQGGFEPHWRRDGKELFYVAPDRTLMAVRATSHPAILEVDPPTPLFPLRIRWMEIQAVARRYAAAADGQRFLINRVTDEAQTVPVTIVLNWRPASK